ncbi:MAG TPA: lipoyl(octanoyl) transferase LipB [bacterium (Candidatus Stahlbacteria)]|nr:lipoyl(octanoyl) transferase LipB [Candidatus Stahlbacteria bacterium]
MEVLDLGRQNYEEVLDLQQNIHLKRVNGEIEDTLILVEHDPVVTMGRSGRIENLLISFTELKRRGIEFFRIERGGDVTYHGPGQLVGYPIFEIKNGFAGIKPFIRTIETVIIKMLKQFGIEAERGPHPGLWTRGKKILSIGIAVKRWVSFHGFALNVNNAPEDFAIINPCGYPGMGMTSIKVELGREVLMEEVKRVLVQEFEIYATGMVKD